MAHIEGGCLCGQVRFSGDAEPAFQAICHCKNCQKQAGTAYSVVIGVPSAAITLTGEVKTYQDTGDSGGTVDRNFCPACGSPLFSAAPSIPGLVDHQGRDPGRRQLGDAADASVDRKRDAMHDDSGGCSGLPEKSRIAGSSRSGAISPICSFTAARAAD